MKKALVWLAIGVVLWSRAARQRVAIREGWRR